MKCFQRTHSTLFFFVSDYLPCWTLWTSVFQNDIHDSFTCRFKLNHWSRWSAWKTLLSGHMILNVPAFSFFLWVWLEMEARGHVFWKNEYTVWANVSPSSPYDLQFPWTNVYIAFLNKQIEIPRTTIWPQDQVFMVCSTNHDSRKVQIQFLKNPYASKRGNDGGGHGKFNVNAAEHLSWNFGKRHIFQLIIKSAKHASYFSPYSWNTVRM